MATVGVKGLISAIDTFRTSESLIGKFDCWLVT